MTDALLRRVALFAQEKALFLPDAAQDGPLRVVLGLSGGADSMALLHILTHGGTLPESVPPLPRFSVLAVHVDHMIRGEEAQRDAQFVREQCARLGVPLRVVQADVPAAAAAAHEGLEEAARRLRYAALEAARAESGAQLILTAHTASDQAETVLLHLLRGCGVGGLAGIPAARGVLRRPLLCCTRAEIEAYCRENGIPYVTDSTNGDTRYLRNAVRHRLLPLMRELSCGTDAALLRLSASAEEDEAYLSSLAADALRRAARPAGGYTAAVLSAAPVPVRGRAIRQALADIGCRSAERRHIERLYACLSSGGRVELPGGFFAAADGGVFTVGRTEDPPRPVTVRRQELPVRFSFGGQDVRLAVFDTEVHGQDVNVHKMFFKYAVDCDRIQGSITVRVRRPGDRMRPAGRGIGKEVRALLGEAGIPPLMRGSFPVVCDERGIVLLPGVTCDERVRVGAHTKHFLVWQRDGERCYDPYDPRVANDGSAKE